MDAYSIGKINELHYNNLKNEISILYEEMFKKRIESLNTAINQNGWKDLFSQLKDDIEDAYSKQKITELHYNLLNKKIIDLEDKGDSSKVST